MKRKKQKTKTLRFAFIFCIGVFVLILMSIAVKTLFLVKNSNFDGSNRFNLEVVGDNNSSVISFSPPNYTITILNLQGKPVNNLSQQLGLPIDGIVNNSNLYFDKTNISSNIYHLLLSFRSDKTNLTIVDFIRLWLFAKDVSSDSIYQRDVSISDSLTISSFISSFFIDSNIANEKTTVEVVNATPTYGLANRFANFISNIGVDVVLVSTGDELKDKSEVLYSKELNYTVKKLSKILNVKPEKISQRDVSEVTVIIGKDVLPNLKF
jgi:hypothetical protein